uniref:Uncharacterized protein n=2 Tax=Caenorhabditis japonica TaxID=281687 RepID=A0A8R1IFT4_CAEJA
MPSADHHVFVEMGGVAAAANQSAVHPPVSQLHSARYAADKQDETTTSSEERKSTTIHDSHGSFFSELNALFNTFESECMMPFLS